MSKEVEEAIEILKCMRLYFSDCEVCTDNDCNEKPCDNLKAIETVLNYIKELEEEKDKLKEGLVKRIAYCNELEKDLFENCENYVVNKSKIRDKIEEIENDKDYKYYDMFLHERDIENTIQVLKELLEEE